MPIEPTATHTTAPTRAVFRDGFGERHRVVSSDGALVDVLRLRPEWSNVAAVESALRERVGRLAAFRHTCFGRVKAIERLRHPAPAIALVCEGVPGVRLVDLLAASEQGPPSLDFGVA